MNQSSGKLIYAIDRDDGGIQVRDDGDKRWMHFGTGSIQSAMDNSCHHDFVLDYMRRMMAFLLFKEKIGRTLILGLGGGAMVRYIHHHWPEEKITAIDIDEDVIKIATNSFGIPSSPKIQIKAADAVFYLSHTIDFNPDTIFLDLFIGDESPDNLYDDEFINSFYETLAPSGVAVINLLPTNVNEFTDLIRKVRKVFDGMIFCLSVPDHDNIILFAFKRPLTTKNVGLLKTKAKLFSSRLDLPFDEYLNNILATNRNCAFITY